MNESFRCRSCGHRPSIAGAIRCSRCGEPIVPLQSPPANPRPTKSAAPLRQGSTARAEASAPIVADPPFERGRTPYSFWEQRPRRSLRTVVAFAVLLLVAAVVAAVTVVAISQAPPESDLETIDLRVNWEPLHAGMIYSRLGRPPSISEEGFLRGDVDGEFAIDVTTAMDATPCEVTIEVSPEGLLERSRWSGTLGRAGMRHTVRPHLEWKQQALLSRLDPGLIEVVAQVRLGDRNTTIRRSFSLRPIQEVHLGFPESFAALVNEDHPWIDPMLREAIDLGVLDQFEPLPETAEEFDRTFRSVFAVWTVMRRRGITYSTIARTSDRVSQYVRTLDEVIRHRQANCADGSAAFASILRRLDVPAAIVIVPGHMFIALKPCEECRWVGLETTLIGLADVAEPVRYQPLASLRDEYDNPSSSLAADWRTFESAVAVGDGHLLAEEPDQPRVVDIQPLRHQGMRPVASRPVLGPIPPIQ